MLVHCVLSLLIGLCSSEARGVDVQCDSQPSLSSEQVEGSRQGPALIQVQKAPVAQKEKHAAHAAAVAFVEKEKHAAQAAAAASRNGVACDPAEHELTALPAVGANDSPVTAYSSLHDVVGSDGVVMISLDSVSTRSAYAAHQLNQLGIRPVKLSATDARCASSKALARGCVHHNDTSCHNDKKAGTGCISRAEQAIGDSHRRALEHAYTRNNNPWTLILEDDAVPAVQDGYDWNIAFSEAWAKLPEGAKIVRLSWCLPPKSKLPLDNKLNAGQFTFTRSSDLMSLGGCTTAYMVHQSILPKMLKVFPCCGAVDSCWDWDFFLKPDPDNGGKKPMDTVLWNMGGQYPSRPGGLMGENTQWGNHFGIMMQNTGLTTSTRSGAGAVHD